MKRYLTPITFLIAGILLGWCGGNLWADHIRELQPVGFDIGTRLTYQTRGVITGAIAGAFVALIATRGIRNNNQK